MAARLKNKQLKCQCSVATRRTMREKTKKGENEEKKNLTKVVWRLDTKQNKPYRKLPTSFLFAMFPRKACFGGISEEFDRVIAKHGRSILPISRRNKPDTPPKRNKNGTIKNLPYPNSAQVTMGPDALDWQNLFRLSKNLDKICPCQIFNLSNVAALNHGKIFLNHKCQSAWLLSIWIHVVLKLVLALVLGWLGWTYGCTNWAELGPGDAAGTLT